MISFGVEVVMSGKVISLVEFRKTRKAQARILKRLIERHLAEAGRMLPPVENGQGGAKVSFREFAEE